MRRRRVLLLAGVVALVAPTAVAAPATAATGTVARVIVRLADPFLVNPVELEVDALDASGDPVQFTGTAVLSTGRTSTTTRIADPGGAALALLPTAALSGGSATVTVTAKGATGAAITRTVRHLVTIPPSFRIARSGCSAIRATGGSMSWAVTWLNGDPIRTPAGQEWVELPGTYRLTDHPAAMVDGDGAPLATHGSVTIRSRTRTVATVPLGVAVRRLVFRTGWSGRVAGAFRPGTYTAHLVLTDAHGRRTTASQPVHVVRRGTMPCL